MMGRNISVVFQVTIAFSTFQCFSCGGDENVCQRALSIQAEFCRGLEHCFPCNCILNGEIGLFKTNQWARPDILNSACSSKWLVLDCEELDRVIAEQCIKDKTSCDPKSYQGIPLFSEDGTPSDEFPGICSFP